MTLTNVLTYEVLWRSYFWLNAMNQCGALLLLLAECQTEAHTLLAGVPSDRQNRPKAYLLLTGRILTVLIFVTIIYYDVNNVYIIILDMIIVVLVAAITIGYKTKLSALLLVVLLTGIHSSKPKFDRLVKNFFQILSVIGGLLMIVVLGPGDLSVDYHKEDW
ncbi:unnamed protein product [Oppiella nova]|uniref:Uncharacterized protein n=1 Tax=Oppiella nova TaxID=334625 RepID=A0A7R9M6H7_9ACAR|nr:unnamed protein product [Oppiella nova]CAG2171675.1 unnamed protein product [Oppiella nova]